MSELQTVVNQIEGIEKSLTDFTKKAEEEMKVASSTSVETKNAIEAMGDEQVLLANRLLDLEQKGTGSLETAAPMNMGDQLVTSEGYKAFVNGSSSKARIEVQNNTSTGSDTNVAPDRKPGIIAGASPELRMESLFPTLPTSSNAIEYVKENSFVNNAAETAEAGAKPESDFTWTLDSTPVRTIAHWTKISKQLAADNAALAAYMNTRMAYGVNQRVDGQLVAGDGTGANLDGFLNAGNFTAHGYADANLGANNKKLALIRKMIADCYIAGYPADHIVLNPADWATIEIEALQSTSNASRVSYNSAGQPLLFGLPVVQGVGMTADQVAVGAFRMAGGIHTRQGVTVELSDSDGSNFTTNLITIRAERRLALTIERPAAIIAGDLTPL